MKRLSPHNPGTGVLTTTALLQWILGGGGWTEEGRQAGSRLSCDPD